MSHIKRIEIEINDLSALKAACKRLGLEFRENQTRFQYYRNQQGECLHAIHVPGAQYEVGIAAHETRGYTLLWDPFYAGGLSAALGEDAGKLKRAYGIESAKIAATKKGYSVTERLKDNGKIVLTLSR